MTRYPFLSPDPARKTPGELTSQDRRCTPTQGRHDGAPRGPLILAALFGCVLACGAFPVIAQELNNPASGTAAAEAAHGRAADLEASVEVRGTGEDAPSLLDVNSVLRDGDVVWTDPGAHAELELGRGLIVRLADDSKLELRQLPPATDLRLWRGAVYVEVAAKEPSALVMTPCGDVQIEPGSVVRIDLSSATEVEEAARVRVISGEVTVQPLTGNPVQVAQTEKIYLDAGKKPDGPYAVDSAASADTFDAYEQSRVRSLAAEPPSPVIADAQDVVGSSELASYGEWVAVDGDQLWHPTKDPNWKPYSDGYWSYVEGDGDVWVDYAPWGYVTSHYGNWSYRSERGWLWKPGNDWKSSSAAWFEFDDDDGNHVAWAPADADGDAVISDGDPDEVEVLDDGQRVDLSSLSFDSADDFQYARSSRSLIRSGFARRPIHGGPELNHPRRQLRHVKETPTEHWGVPRAPVRGSVIAADGRTARAHALDLETRASVRRSELIARHFGTDPERDLHDLKAGEGNSYAEKLQFDPAAHGDTKSQTEAPVIRQVAISTRIPHLPRHPAGVPLVLASRIEQQRDHHFQHGAVTVAASTPKPIKSKTIAGTVGGLVKTGVNKNIGASGGRQVAAAPNAKAQRDAALAAKTQSLKAKQGEAGHLAVQQAEAVRTERVARDAQAEKDRLAALARDAQAEKDRLATQARTEQMARDAQAEKDRLAAQARTEQMARDAQAEKDRLAAQARAEQLARDAQAEKDRLAAQARAEQLARDAQAEKDRLAAQARAEQLARDAQAERDRMAAQAERDRMAAQAERDRMAAQAERDRMAAQAREEQAEKEREAAKAREEEAARVEAERREQERQAEADRRAEEQQRAEAERAREEEAQRNKKKSP